MSRDEQGGPADNGSASRAARSDTSLPATTDMPMALGDCIAELAEHLGIEVTR